MAVSLLIRGECVLVLLVDVSSELLDLGEELGLCWIVALLFGRPLATQSQPRLGQTQEMFILCDGHLEILSDPLLAGKFRQNLERRDMSHQTEVNQYLQILKLASSKTYWYAL